MSRCLAHPYPHSPLLSVESMMPLRLAQAYPPSHSFLPPHAVGRGLEPLGSTFVMSRAVGTYCAASSGRAVPVPPPYSACARCWVLVRIKALYRLGSNGVAGVSCVMPPCLAQPCP